jgi:hypothetical protein
VVVEGASGERGSSPSAGTTSVLDLERIMAFPSLRQGERRSVGRRSHCLVSMRRNAPMN